MDMKRSLVLALGFFAITESAYAQPTEQQYAERWRAERKLIEEVKSTDGFSPEEAQEVSNQIITSMKKINAAQLDNGMSCEEINDYITPILDKSDPSPWLLPLKYKTGKYQLADCAVQVSWRK